MNFKPCSAKAQTNSVKLSLRLTVVKNYKKSHFFKQCKIFYIIDYCIDFRVKVKSQTFLVIFNHCAETTTKMLRLLLESSGCKQEVLKHVQRYSSSESSYIAGVTFFPVDIRVSRFLSTSFTIHSVLCLFYVWLQNIILSHPSGRMICVDFSYNNTEFLAQ